MLGKGLQDVTTMSNGLIDMSLLDEAFDFTIVYSQRDFCHYRVLWL